MAFRILIADDHPAIRKVLRSLIESHAEWQVCGEAENGAEAVARATELKPDLVILDLAMPVLDGIRAAREISRALPGIPILMHTMHGSPAVNLEAKKAGVSRVVSKGESGNNLVNAIADLLKAGENKAGSEPAGFAAGTELAAAAAASAGTEPPTPDGEKTSESPPPAPDAEKTSN